MKRHNARILAVMTLYNMDVNQYSNEAALECFEQIQKLEREYEYPVEIDYEFSRELVAKSIENLHKIDELIAKSLVKYTIDRLSYVDRAIIRLSTYEMLMTSTAKEVIIDEALWITREYSNLNDDAQVKFTNRLLENIAKEIYE
ncbi:MAG: transcription antitermination factor NusB [Prevotella sp.]|nr:transcription antitermination factor NusB [Staphylococcus sp.]MCM1349774.1 transcription antitermination factor NusB [Prevotella sp.]